MSDVDPFDLSLTLDTSELTLEEIDNMGEPPPTVVRPPVMKLVPSGRTLSRTGADTSRFVFCDVETIPDAERQHLFDEVVERYDPMLSAAQLRKGTVEEIRDFLGEYGDSLPDSYIEEVRTIESAPTEAPKSRATVLGMLTKLQSRRIKELEKKPKVYATTPEYCKIISMSIAVGDGPPITLVVGQVPQAIQHRKPLTERDLLEFFWSVVESYSPIVVYNGANFDLPAICIRSALLGVHPTRVINMSPWGDQVVDLMVKRFPRSKPMPMKTLTQLYGLPNYGDDCDGSMVAELYKTDPVKVGIYNGNDVLRLRDLFYFLSGYFWM